MFEPSIILTFEKTNETNGYCSYKLLYKLVEDENVKVGKVTCPYKAINLGSSNLDLIEQMQKSAKIINSSPEPYFKFKS
jgi:hypothetical protein